MAKEIPYKIYLEGNEMPTQWYNVRADMKKKPAPILNPATLQPVTLDELSISSVPNLQSHLQPCQPYNLYLHHSYLKRVHKKLCVFFFHCLTISGRADIYT